MTTVKMVFLKVSLEIFLSLFRIQNISTPPLAAGIGNSTLHPCSALTHHAACAVFALTEQSSSPLSPYLRRAICV